MYRVRHKFCDSFNKCGQKSKIICYKYKFNPFVFYVVNIKGILEPLKNKNINIMNIIHKTLKVSLLSDLTEFTMSFKGRVFGQNSIFAIWS
jgi:hypothetical protein